MFNFLVPFIYFFPSTTNNTNNNSMQLNQKSSIGIRKKKTSVFRDTFIEVYLEKVPILFSQNQMLSDITFPTFLTLANGVPVILLLFNGGPLDISWPLESPDVPVIVECFFSAQATGRPNRPNIIFQ